VAAEAAAAAVAAEAAAAAEAALCLNVTYAMCDLYVRFPTATKAFCSSVVEKTRSTGHR
jgi:hypothetical protein